jgi:hypothetical protein
MIIKEVFQDNYSEVLKYLLSSELKFKKKKVKQMKDHFWTLGKGLFMNVLSWTGSLDSFVPEALPY